MSNRSATIGEAARATGVSAKMIRSYEETGLLGPADRTASGYRVYGESDLHALRFVRRARDLGFTLAAVRELLALSDDKSQSCEAVDHIARVQLVEVDRKIRDLTALRTELDRVLGACRHGKVADCKIIETLAPL